jgi:hypothetical protein
MRAAVAFLCAVSFSGAIAGLIPDKERDELTAAVLGKFWGRAKLSNGEVVQPFSEEDRNTVPVSKGVAYRALDAGEISGLGEWCGLDWKDHFLSLTKSARSRGFTEKQVAFFSFLHGAAQDRIATSMKKSGTCSDENRMKVETYLKQSKERGLSGI